jgi:hypothetical protein
VVIVTDPYGRKLGFLELEPLLFLHSSHSIVLTRLSGSKLQTRYFSENVVVLGIEPGTLDL